MEPQHVAPSELESADGWLIAKAAMCAMPIVFMNPVRQARGALPRKVVAAAVGPFALRARANCQIKRDANRECATRSWIDSEASRLCETRHHALA